MNKSEIYKELKDIQRLIWKDDDTMDQETLFELQSRVGHLTLKLAVNLDKKYELMYEFPWLYKTTNRECR